MIKVRYPVSGAVFRADVEGVGPTVVLKQMYNRHRLDFSCAADQLTFPPFTIFPFFKKDAKINTFLCLITPRLSARCSFRCGFFFFSPSLPLPTMLFLFLSGSSYKHLLCESDKPYPKPQRKLQPKATNRGRP